MGTITREGYIVDKSELTQDDIRKLTVTPKTLNISQGKPFKVFVELNDYTVAVPRYWAQDRFGFADTFLGNVCSAPNMIFNGSLKSAVQERAANVSVKKLTKDGGGILCLPTGSGKTVISLHIACAIKVKTLVVVHKVFLMNQWADRIAQFVPSAKVGKLQQNIVDVDGCDIVVGMLQSIAMKPYNSCVFDGFGFVIFDEVHVVPAPVLSRAFLKVCSPCMLGISATPERWDGMSKVIKMFIGPVIMTHELSGRADVKVRVVPYYNKHDDLFSRINNNIYFVKLAGMITMLCKDINRNNFLLKTIQDLVTTGYKVISLSHRRDHCTELYNNLQNVSIYCSLYLGGMKIDELKRSEGASVIIATYSMAKEGLDIPGLNALVLATPKSDVVQACGRILHGENANPIVIDVVDNIYTLKVMSKKRMLYYKKSGFKIIESVQT